MFNIADLLEEQVDAHLNRLRRNGWLTFKGPEAVDLLRRVLALKTQPPILIVNCHRQLAFPPLEYEGFVPQTIEVQARKQLVTITGICRADGTRHTLYWSPGKSGDPSGQYLSSVSALDKCFPGNEIAAVEIPALTF